MKIQTKIILAFALLMVFIYISYTLILYTAIGLVFIYGCQHFVNKIMKYIK